MKLNNLLISKENLTKGFSERKFYWFNLLLSGFIVSCFSFYIFAYLSKTYSFAVNTTPSLPYQLFIFSKNFEDGDFKRFAIMEFRSPVSHYQTISKGDSLSKKLGCIPGDILKTIGLEYYCNNYPMGKAIEFDSSKRPMKRQFIYNGVIPPDSYFVLGDHPNSFDSRYYGFIKKKDFTGVSIWKH